MQSQFYCPKCQKHVAAKLNTELSELAPTEHGTPDGKIHVYYITCENCKETIIGGIAVKVS